MKRNYDKLVKAAKKNERIVFKGQVVIQRRKKSKDKTTAGKVVRRSVQPQLSMSPPLPKKAISAPPTTKRLRISDHKPIRNVEPVSPSVFRLHRSTDDASSGSDVIEPPALPLFRSIGSGEDHFMHRNRSGELWDIDEPDTRSGRTPLIEAICNQNFRDFESLLERNASVNVKDSAGFTPLQWAFKKLDAKAARALISRGAELTHTDEADNTFLHSCMLFPAALGALLLDLLDRGVDIDRQNKNGNTALVIAANNKDLESMKMLLHCGADMNLRNDNGSTALMIACDSCTQTRARLPFLTC